MLKEEVNPELDFNKYSSLIEARVREIEDGSTFSLIDDSRISITDQHLDWIIESADKIKEYATQMQGIVKYMQNNGK